MSYIYLTEACFLNEKFILYLRCIRVIMAENLIILHFCGTGPNKAVQPYLIKKYERENHLKLFVPFKLSYSVVSILSGIIAFVSSNKFMSCMWSSLLNPLKFPAGQNKIPVNLLLIYIPYLFDCNPPLIVSRP